MNQPWFRSRLEALEYVHVPRVFWDWTTDRVLTMSYVEGKRLGEWLAGKPSVALRDLVGSRLFELFYFQVFRVHVLHADPHPGNYLFSDRGEVGLVDFGCVKEIAPEFTELVRSFLEQDRRTENERVERMARLIWGPQTPRKHERSRRVLKAAFEFGAKVCPLSAGKPAPVDFGDPSLFEGLLQIAKEVLRGKLPRPEYVFVKRAEIGLYNVLHQLAARVRTVELMRRLALG